MRFGLFTIALSSLLLCGCSEGPVTWWSHVNSKAQDLSTLEARFHALEGEHEQLKKDYYRLENEALELRALVQSKEVGERNLKATGTLGGRSLSSISYEVPKGLRADEVLSLAYEHFTEQRFPQAAATFEDLFKRPESAGLVDASSHYTAGVAWFQLGNYVKARENFDEAMNSASGEQREKIHKKVDLWMRAIDRKQRGGGTLGG
ncbi:MAG: tetratricopeptide repeat protein [Bdellovibrionota bacterium]